jgi:hypothetical protein
VLEALGAILIRGLGLAAVTVPVGVAIATAGGPGGDALRPEWTAQERRRRVRAEARDHRRAERLTQSPRVTASDALGWPSTRPRPCHPGVGPPGCAPAGPLGLTTLLDGQPGTGKSTAAEPLAHLAARERRAICVIDGKGTDGLAEAIDAVLAPTSTTGRSPRTHGGGAWPAGVLADPGPVLFESAACAWRRCRYSLCGSSPPHVRTFMGFPAGP